MLNFIGIEAATAAVSYSISTGNWNPHNFWKSIGMGAVCVQY